MTRHFQDYVLCLAFPVASEDWSPKMVEARPNSYSFHFSRFCRPIGSTQSLRFKEPLRGDDSAWMLHKSPQNVARQLWLLQPRLLTSYYKNNLLNNYNT